MNILAKKTPLDNTNEVERVNSNVPEQLKQLDQWVVWKYGYINGKKVKLPFNPLTGSGHGWNKKQNWGDYDTAFKAWVEDRQQWEGIGFVLSKDDPFALIDLDKCINTDNSLSELAKETVKLTGSYTEVSPSGRGLHILGLGSLEGTKNALKQEGIGFEIYTANRFATFTGDVFEGRSNWGNIQEAINHLQDIYKAHTQKGGTRVVGEGGRNNAMFLESSKLNHMGLTPQTVLKTVTNLNATVCNPPLSPDEVNRLVASATSYPSGKDIDKTLTDDGVSSIAAKVIGDQLVWLDDTQEWAVWNSEVKEWIISKHTSLVDGIVRKICCEFLQPIIEELHPEAFTDDKKIKKYIGQTNRYKSAQKMRDVKALLKTEPTLSGTSGDFDKPQWGNYARVANGLIDLRSGELIEIDSQQKITRRLGWSGDYKGISYNPDSKCPEWESFLMQISCNDPEWVKYIQVLCGYFLISKNPERKFFNFYGEGQNGKSTLLKVLQNIMGGVSSAERGFYFTLPISSICKQQFDSNGEELTRGVRARLAVASESSEGKSLDDSKIKSITGGDEIAIRKLYEGTTTVYPDFTLVIQTNHPLVFRGDDQAMVDRVVLIPFDYRIPEEQKNPHFVETVLLPEREGILAWLVEGSKIWAKDRLPHCERIVKATSSYVDNNNLPQLFAEQCLKKVKDHQVPTRDVFIRFVEWCKTEGHPEPQKNNGAKQNFNKTLCRVMKIEKGRGTGNKPVFKDIDLIKDEEDLDPPF